MLLNYRKPVILAVSIICLAGLFSSILMNKLQPPPDTRIFLNNMVSSYTFQDDVYLLNLPALKNRLTAWVSHLYDINQQPICLSAQFITLVEDPALAVSVCSPGTTLSELATHAHDSGAIDMRLGERKLGTIEWLTGRSLDFYLLGVLLLCFTLSGTLIVALGYWLFSTNAPPQTEQPGLSIDTLRPLYRIMSSNRRTMAFHDNWVYGERAHPYINFINLDGSRLRLRASLSDIAALFPGTRYINRRAIINTAAGVHQIQGQKVILKIKTGDLEYDIDPQYQELFTSPLQLI